MYTRLLAALQRERGRTMKDFQGDLVGNTEFIKGMRQGLAFAIKITQEMRRSALAKVEQRKISRWLAADLRQACRTSLAYLKACDRQRAIDTLERALVRVERPWLDK